MPIYRRLRKRGFKNPFRIAYQAVNLNMISSRFQAGETVDSESLKQKRLIQKIHKPVKVLARGEIDKALTVKVDSISERARAAIEKAGGEVILTAPVREKEKPTKKVAPEKVEKPKAEPADEGSADTSQEVPEEIPEGKTSDEPKEDSVDSKDKTSDEGLDNTPEP
jgi:ribosomal protein L18E